MTYLDMVMKNRNFVHQLHHQCNSFHRELVQGYHKHVSCLVYRLRMLQNTMSN